VKRKESEILKKNVISIVYTYSA